MSPVAPLAMLGAAEAGALALALAPPARLSVGTRAEPGYHHRCYRRRSHQNPSARWN
jgi:hypothetical protein